MSENPSPSETPFDASMQEAVAALRARFPTVPFLTLGQTVLWDEPVKAAFCRVLEELAPDAQIVAAVHDTDYFAKLAHLENQDEKFALLEHNDGDTRGLWSAAGEISSLFGSETVPTRHKLNENGVAFDRVARHYPGGTSALLNAETNAWGWRALVHTEDKPLLAGEVLLRDIAPKLIEQIRWAFDESLRCLGTSLEGNAGAKDDHARVCTCPAPCESREVAVRVVRWVEEYAASEPDATLSDLYRWLTPRLWAVVRGTGSCNLQTSHSLKIFRFNRETAAYPRFSFVDLFLNPATRETARNAYNAAVQGSGIYTLDQFGEGALPFDVVIPQRGRGTLRLQQDSLVIETEPPIKLTGATCESVAQLAEILEAKFGPDVVLVGKAVSLISMLAQEMIFVFHEKASSYTKLTQKMNAGLREAGVPLDLHPLLRLKYATWDSLSEVETHLCLPPHLERAFAAKSVSGRDFAARWKEVCDAQDAMLADLKACRSPRELLNFLAREEASWRNGATDYAAAREIISMISERARVLQSQVEELRANAKSATQKAVQIEREKGEDFRARVLPLRERIRDVNEAAVARINPVDENNQPRKLTKDERTQIVELEKIEVLEIESLKQQIPELQSERSHFDEAIATYRTAARQAQSEAKTLIAQRVAMETSAEAKAARETICRWEYEAELERLRRVRDAITVSEGLRYTNYRPTAWWLPLVSPDGKWLEKLAQTAQARIEEI